MIKTELDPELITRQINYLCEWRLKLLNSDLPPEGVWIHEYVVKRTYPSGSICYFRYAKWQAREAIFKRNPKPNALPLKRGKNKKYTNHRHIGRIGSNTGLKIEPHVVKAYESYKNRLILEAIEKHLLDIQLILAKFEKYEVTHTKEH